MHRRPIDVVFSIGFFAAAALLAVVGFVMADNARFIDSSTATQIRDLNVAFPARDVLTDQERAVPCIAANASKMVLTPGQAKCYASNFLGERIEALLQQGVATPAARDALSRGNSLRALMQTNVTMSGFSDHTRYIADVAYIASAVFALAGMAGLAHWSTEAEVVEEPQPVRKVRRKPATA
ncbi:MAG: hypothetical protein QOG90_1460 [Actinomycetota bacterium]|jgi:hypothetical protein